MSFKTKWFLRKGIAFKETELKKDDGGFDLRKWLKRELEGVHVPYYDNCCQGAADPSTVQYDLTNDTLQYYDPVTKTFVDVTSTGPTLTANRAVITDGTGALAPSTVTNTQLGYLSGVTSAIQTQLNNRATLVAAPATAASPGTTGQIAVASGFFYACVATNTWQRVAIATW